MPRILTIASLLLSVVSFGGHVSAQACGAATGGCDVLAYCENITMAGVYTDTCVCPPGTIGVSDFTSNDPPFTSGACNTNGFAVRYVISVTDLDDEMVAAYSHSEGFALCQPGAKGYYLRNIESKLEVNCLYASSAGAAGELSNYSSSSIEVGPAVYAWTLPTTSEAHRIPPTGMVVNSVTFNPSCAESGCWVIRGNMTTGEAFNSFTVFNTFFLPQTNSSDDISYDADYSAEEWTFQAANHPCSSVNYGADSDNTFGVSYCCIDKPDAGSTGGFVANYRPTQNFVDWQGAFACDRRVQSSDGTTKCWKYMGNVIDTWQMADARCRVAGGHLPSIADQAENDLFRDMALEKGLGRTWIGAWDRNEERNFTWTDGTAGPGVKGVDPYFENWYGNNPNEGGPAPFREDCTEMYISRGLTWGSGWGSVPSNAVPGEWNDKECAQYKFNYFCQFEGDREPARRAAGEGCVDHVVQRPGHSAPDPASNPSCWKVVKSKKSWNEAEASCQAIEGHLAAVQSPEEFHLMRRMLMAQGVSRAWLGLTDEATEGTFKWVNSTVEFDVTPPYPFMGWKVGYPKSFKGQGESRDCVSVEGSSFWWQDRDCDDALDFVCEVASGEGVACDNDFEPEDQLWDVPFPVNYNRFMTGAFKDMPNSPGVVAFDNVDPFFGLWSFEVHLDEVELRTKAGQLRGTVGVEHSVDTFLGVTNFRPTGREIMDTLSTQAALHLEKTNFFSVSTHGVNQYTFLEYVNVRLVTVLQEDADFSGNALERTTRTDRSGNVNYIQVTFTLGPQFEPNIAPDGDAMSSGLIPLSSVRAGRGTFVDEVEAAGGMEAVCQAYAEAASDDAIGLGVGPVAKGFFDTALQQTCAPSSQMCSSPSSTPDSFVSFNVPLGQEVFDGQASDDLSNSVFVDMVINAIDTDARDRGTNPGTGEDPWQVKTTLSASIPIVNGGVNVFCDGLTARTDLKDVANADIVVGTARNATELTRLRVLEDVASSALSAVPRSDVSAPSVEAAMLTLVLKGNASYFTSAGNANTGGYSLELDDLMTIHLMEDGDAGTVDAMGVSTNSKETELIALLAQSPDDNSDSATGLDTSGYKLNGAFRFDVDRGRGIARLNPTAELLEVCAFSVTRPLGTTPLETCVLRRDVHERGFPVRVGAGGPTAVEVLKQEGLLATDDLEAEAQALEGQREEEGGCGCDRGGCCEAGFMQSVLGSSGYARGLAVDYAGVLHARYGLNGRYTRAFWINPGYEWAPTQTAGRSIFAVSAKVYLFALVTVDENVSRRRMLLASEPVDLTESTGSSAAAASVTYVGVSQRSMLARAFEVPEEKVAVFAVEMRLRTAEACLPDDLLQTSLQVALAEYVQATASAHLSVQVVALARDAGEEDCARRRRRVGGRSLLEEFSTASASVQMMVVFAEEGEAVFNPEALEAMPGVLSVAPQAAAGVLLDPEFNRPAEPSGDGGVSRELIIVAASAGAGGLLLLVAGALCCMRARSDAPAAAAVGGDVVYKVVDKATLMEECRAEGAEAAPLPRKSKSLRFDDTPAPAPAPAPAPPSPTPPPPSAPHHKPPPPAPLPPALPPAQTTAPTSPQLATPPRRRSSAPVHPPPDSAPVRALPDSASTSRARSSNSATRSASGGDGAGRAGNAPQHRTLPSLPPLPEPVAHYDMTKPQREEEEEDEENPVLRAVAGLWSTLARTPAPEAAARPGAHTQP